MKRPQSLIGWKLYRLAWPSYECRQCVGQEPWQGCYCAYYGGSAPGVGPETWRVYLRRVLQFLFGWREL